MIFIYDNTLTQLGAINNYASFNIKEQLRGVGNFILSIAKIKSGTEYLVPGNFISIDGKSGLIVSRELSQTQGQFLIIKGTTLLGILNQRIAR